MSPLIQMDDKGEEKMGKAANSSISLKQIHVTDNFWNKYVHLVKDVIIPYQWDILNDKLEDVETSHCIENFKIAAGEKEGEFQGAVFQDTDVAKWLEAVGFVLNYERDEKLEELADETIELIGRAQQPDGYLNTYFTIKEPDIHGFFPLPVRKSGRQDLQILIQFPGIYVFRLLHSMLLLPRSYALLYKAHDLP